MIHWERVKHASVQSWLCMNLKRISGLKGAVASARNCLLRRSRCERNTIKIGVPMMQE